MAPWLILVVAAIYVIIAIDLICAGKTGLSLVFVAYALANIGLWMDAR